MEKELVREQTLNLEISLNGAIVDGFDKINDIGDSYFSIGLLFCPKLVCKNGEEIITLDSTNPEEEHQGECFKVFKTLFEKLKEKDLVSYYDINEIECFLEASHTEYPFLDLITMVQNENYYGLGFNILDFKTGLLVFGQIDINLINEWLLKLINIIEDIKVNFNLLKDVNLDYKIENFVSFEIHSM